MTTFRFIVSVALTATLALVVSCASKDSGCQAFNYDVDPATVGVTAEQVASLDSLLQSFIDTKQMPCVTVFVAKGGDVVYNKSFGMKNLETQAPAEVYNDLINKQSHNEKVSFFVPEFNIWSVDAVCISSAAYS